MDMQNNMGSPVSEIEQLEAEWRQIRPLKRIRGKRIALEESRFGRLKALACVGWDRNGGALWECACLVELGGCGGTKIVSRNALMKGRVKSCGCLQAEIRRKSA